MKKAKSGIKKLRNFVFNFLVFSLIFFALWGGIFLLNKYENKKNAENYLKENILSESILSENLMGLKLFSKVIEPEQTVLGKHSGASVTFTYDLPKGAKRKIYKEKFLVLLKDNDWEVKSIKKRKDSVLIIAKKNKLYLTSTWPITDKGLAWINVISQ